MALWGKSDAASNTSIFTANQLKKAANSANKAALYGNTTANAFIDGTTTGVFAVDANEIAAGGGKVAHTGWILRTVGQGGRAGRVQTEVLVAGGIITDGSDDAVYPDYTLRFSTQPVSNTTEAADSEISFVVVAESVPAGANIAYKWYQSANGNVYVPAAAGTTGNTTDTLVVANNTPVDGYFYQVVISATGAANVTSTSVTANVA